MNITLLKKYEIDINDPLYVSRLKLQINTLIELLEFEYMHTGRSVEPKEIDEDVGE